MFHSQAWLSFCDAAQKLHASIIPWLLAALATLWVLLIAIELGLPPHPIDSAGTGCNVAVAAFPPGATVPQTCTATQAGMEYSPRYPAVSIGILLAPY